MSSIEHAERLAKMVFRLGHRYCSRKRRWLIRDQETRQLRWSTAPRHHGIQTEAFAFVQANRDEFKLGKNCHAKYARSLAYSVTHDPLCQLNQPTNSGEFIAEYETANTRSTT